MSSAQKETEIKLALENLARMRARLRRLGFRVAHPRAFENNLVFDTPARELKRRGCLLRVRETRGRRWLTFKGPAAPSRQYKERAEIDIEVLNGREIHMLLQSLGFEPVFRYQKFRTVFRARAPWQGGEVVLDETPVGAFLELEGPRRWIRRLARALDFSEEEFITATYSDLYVAWCRRRRRRPAHMVFPTGRRPLS